MLIPIPMSRDLFNPSAASPSGSGLYKATALMSTSPWSQWQGDGGWPSLFLSSACATRLQAACRDKEAAPPPPLPHTPSSQLGWGGGGGKRT